MIMKIKVLAVLLAAAVLLVPAAAAPGVSTTLKFDELDAAGPNGGDWYKDATNEEGTLAWGESYVMMAYAQMYETTRERRYLDRLAEHADGVIAQRDDARGVADYTGTANPCWQATRYSTQPMCWAVHSGMLTFPMAMFAAYVAERGELAAAATYDGSSYAEKAASILAAVVETYDFHEPAWRDEGSSSGTYVFPPDASFYEYAGDEMPLNQMNAMGNTALALWLATGEESYRGRAERLANHLAANLTTGSGNTYLWNYWGGAYAAPGEDISHAAISVGFAALCARSGVVFTAADMLRFGNTFFDSVIIDNKNSHDYIGGGSVNGDSYRPQMGRWAILGEWDPRAVAAVRNVYDTYASVGSGSVLLGFAYLARWEYPIRPFVFYVADWDDLGDRRQATAYGANVSTLPPDPAVPVFFRMRFEARRGLTVDQWDGDAYHGVLKLAATDAGPETVVVAYDPRWWFLYTADGALFQFTDAFVAGQGIVVYEPEPCEAPVIGSPPADAELASGDLYTAAPAAAGQAPMLWFLDGPADASVDRETGEVTWTADFSGGPQAFELEARNDCGSATAAWTLGPLALDEGPEPVDPPPEAPDAADGAPEGFPDATDAAGDQPVADGTEAPADVPQDGGQDAPAGDGSSGSCGCTLAR
jgi:hypothetical protein